MTLLMAMNRTVIYQDAYGSMIEENVERLNKEQGDKQIELTRIQHTSESNVVG